jgi:rhomboid protease GluP
MPVKSETIPVNEADASAILAIAYGTLEKLKWTIKYAGENTLTACTPAERNFTGEDITIQANVNELTITSKTVHGESFDTPGINKTHIENFLAAFETIKTSAGEMQISEWQSKINPLREQTMHLAVEEKEQTEKLEQIMNSSSGNLYVTYIIIAINVLVFIVMVLNGVSFISPTGEDIVKWGGNFAPYTNSGDWWRLVSSVFVHIGFIHLLFNMYALYMVGVYLEPMLGKTKYTVAYLCTGIFASLLSLWWHHTPVASAGASGAIFGMFGVFLALLSTNLVPKKARKQLLQSIGIFVGYNLLYGMRSGVDNAAHIGGLVSGLLIGYIYYLQLRKTEENSQAGYQPAIIALATILAAFLYLKSSNPVIRSDDSEKFSRTMEHFGALEELALEAMQPSDTTSKEAYLKQLKKTALNDWVDCVTLFEEAEKFKLNRPLQSLRVNMLQYSNHRLQQTLLFIRAAEEETEKYGASIDSIQKEIDAVIEKIKEINSPSADHPATRDL